MMGFGEIQVGEHTNGLGGGGGGGAAGGRETLFTAPHLACMSLPLHLAVSGL